MGVSSAATPSQPIEQVPVRDPGDGYAARWGDLVVEHESYIEDKRGDHLVFVGTGMENRDNILAKPYTHRWTEAYTSRQYARMHDFVRGAMEEYEDPYVVILPALTASTVSPVGRYRPPLDHFDQLKQSWDRGVRYELNHVMNASRQKDRWPAREFEYIQVWEPTTDAGYTEGGYAHLHPVVVCEGKVGKERFRSVLEKHVEKTPWATAEAHDVQDVDIRPLEDLNNPAAYLFKYLSKSWDREEMAPYQKRFDALLHETGYRRFQPSDGAQRWMMKEDDEASEPWAFVGVANPDEVGTLEEYEDAGEFRVDREMGVGTYLAGYEAAPAVAIDAETEGVCDHEQWYRGRCVGCGVSEMDLVAAGSPDRPPPGG